MPTERDQSELMTKCTWTWTTQNGVNGYKVTSKTNGNSIFLPASGIRIDNQIKSTGFSGSYLSTDLSDDESVFVQRFDSTSYVYWYYSPIYRYPGCSVRPVCP